MKLSIKQYASLLVLVLTLLVSMFAYHVSINLETSRRLVEESHSEQARAELSNGIRIVMDLVRRSADSLTAWEEIKQQVNNPSFFAYWYEVRFRKYSFDLAVYTDHLMIYDNEGRALEQVPGNPLPLMIDTSSVQDFDIRIVDDSSIVYTVPLRGNDGDNIGYLSNQLQLIALMKAINAFASIERDSIRLVPQEPSGPMTSLGSEYFEYLPVRSHGLLNLEQQVRASLIGLAIAVVISTLFLFAVLVVIVGLPLKRIDAYINRLRMNKGDIVEIEQEETPIQITELKRVQDSLQRYHTELKHNQEYLALTLESIGDAVITTDASGQVVQMNAVAENLTGWRFEDARNRSVQEIVELTDDGARRYLVDGLSGGGAKHYDGDILLRSRDDRDRYVLISVSQMRDAAGAVRGAVLVLNDITEQKIRDEQLQHSQKMDALGKLTGGIAHDFNNSLNVILGFSELLLRALEGREKESGYATQIYNAGERARSLTTKLLTFSRKETSSASELKINDLLEEQQPMLQRSLTARVYLEYELETELWGVFLDGDQLSDAVLNMCINSMHAMPGGGEVKIRTRNVVLEKGLNNAPDLLPGEYVAVSVSDSGTGMDPITRRKVFEPFFTTKGDEGTGLGLSQVYGFVKRCHGSVVIDSELGSGTTITMYLPRHEAQTDKDAGLAESTSLRQTERGHETLLVVDDEPALVELAATILTDNDYHVMRAGSGKEALSILETVAVDLMITDVIMPGMDGYELINIVSERYPATSMMLVSGFTDEANRSPREGLENIRLLMKPYSAVELLYNVRQVLDERDTLKQASNA